MTEPIRKTVGFVRLVPPDEWVPQRIAEHAEARRRQQAICEEEKRAKVWWRKAWRALRGSN